MPDRLARAMATAIALLLAAALAALYLTSRPPSGATEVVAEFRNAFPLIEGMHVRVDGAVAGSVGSIEVDEEGIADVTLVLNEAVEDPRADASAAIRQQDTTGDSYVAFEPGSAARPLPEAGGRPTIECDARGAFAPCANTLVAPRFDDLLNAFGPQERAGLRLLLSELANALENRGADVNRAALELRPALEAANRALAEVNRQRGALRALIEDAEAVTGQAASRRRELGRAIESLARALDATAAQRPELDASLERLPPTVERARSTLAALRRAAAAGEPLARELETGAGDLARVLRRAPGFLEDAGSFTRRALPTLRLTRRLLRAGQPTIETDPRRIVTGPFDLAPALSNLLSGVLGDENTFEAFFGDDSGGTGPGTLSRRGFGAIAVEPGNQPLYPPEHANRNFLRVTGVINCESFGVPVRPGCLAEALTALRAGHPPTGATLRGARRSSVAPPAPAPAASGGGGSGEAAGESGGRQGAGRGDRGSAGGASEALESVNDLLGFLLG